MTLPIDLVLVRHGQSEGNAAKRLSEAGDNSAFTEEFRDRHSTSFHLTMLGREQTVRAGRCLRQEFFQNGYGFDRYISSDCVRARETAGLLYLPEALWTRDVYLTERDWGDLDIMPENERAEKFGDFLRRRRAEPFLTRPMNGENFLQLLLRIDRRVDTWHRQYQDMRVLVVCHGEVMRAIEISIEHIPPERFKELTFSEKPEDKIFNCQIVHYTRRDPQTGRIDPFVQWKRWIRPTEDAVTTSGWQPIVRSHYTNEELLKSVES